MITIAELAASFDARRQYAVHTKRGVSPGYLLSRLPVAAGRQVLVVCENERTMRELAGEFRFFMQDVFLFPSLEVLPYGRTAPQGDLVGERMSTLFRAAEGTPGVYLATVRALAEPVMPPDVLREQYLYLVEGEESDFGELRRSLPLLGYQPVENVEMQGEFAVKGGIIDLFSPLYPRPLRLEFSGDIVESIRQFDPQTQRSVETRRDAAVLPARDFVYRGPAAVRALECLKDFADAQGIEKRLRDEIAEKLDQRIFFPGMEFLLPVLFGRRITVSAYFDDPCVCLYRPEDIGRERNSLAEAFEKAYRLYSEKGGFIAPPDVVFGLDELGALTSSACLRFESFGSDGTLELDFGDNAEIEERRKVETTAARTDPRTVRHPLELLKEVLADRRDMFKTLIVCTKRRQCEKMAELLSFYGIPHEGIAGDFGEFARRAQKGDLFLAPGRPAAGFKNFGDGVWLITEEEVFGIVEKKKEVKRKDLSAIISTIYELKEGDLAVHLDHGIGIFRGLKQVSVLGRIGEFIELEYADSGKLFVPVEKINLIQKYIASEDHVAKIDRLGEKKWQKVKKKAKEDLRKWAEEIVRTEAVRRTHEGLAFAVDRVGLDEFAATFEYEETEDQKKAIEEVLADMEGAKPMDRIVCGDVGFGKTEVALRAAFVAASAGKQVAVIAPTTILVEQHYEVFRRRLAPFGLGVGMLSRFVDAKRQKEVTAQVKEGALAVVIGTHRLLGRDVAFRDLGLLIIDEEHKFGVAHKERLKNLKATMDVLTLTATPIPRTLHMSLSGLKDISVIASPPEGRLSIRTYVARFSPEVIREAVEREVQRGGQVYFVHNRVRSIFSMQRYLEERFPDLHITVAHGRMDEDDLKAVMDEFREGRQQVLLSTAIIESGLDLPNVNTIIVNRADKFGLADLYQLRGRVGRSARRAYAYFLVPSFELITKDALKRLRALQELEELGSGFRLAVHDLEIRGAGDLLGRKQSGHINEIGLELYMQFLDEAIREIRFERGDRFERQRVETEVNLPAAAYIPESYLPSTRERLEFYKRIFGVKDTDALTAVADEMTDRFGPVPPELANFIYQKETEIRLSAIGIVKCSIVRDNLVLAWDSEYVPPRERLFGILKKNQSMKFAPPDKVYAALSSKGQDMTELRNVLHDFIESVKIQR